jgi:hypothetical protein
MGGRLWCRYVASAATGLAVLLITGCAGSTAGGQLTGTAAPTTVTPTATTAPAAAPLRCTARVTVRRPAAGSVVGVRVRTVPRAWVTAIAYYRTADAQKAGRASASGRRVFSFSAGAAPGFLVPVDVSASLPGRRGSCMAAFRVPRTAAVPQPSHATTAAPPPPPASCHPLTNSGRCYEPGEFCRETDHGASGVAADGEAITCEDNNGWRWEPS